MLSQYQDIIFSELILFLVVLKGYIKFLFNIFR